MADLLDVRMVGLLEDRLAAWLGFQMVDQKGELLVDELAVAKAVL
jgi:hypothetical protein